MRISALRSREFYHILGFIRFGRGSFHSLQPSYWNKSQEKLPRSVSPMCNKNKMQMGTGMNPVELWANRAAERTSGEIPGKITGRRGREQKFGAWPFNGNGFLFSQVSRE